MSIIRSVVAYTPAVILPRLAAMLMIVVLTRLMPKSEYGLFTLVITMGEALDGISSNWLRIALARFGAAAPETIGREMIRCSLFYGGTFLVSVVFAFAFSVTLALENWRSFAVALSVYMLAIGIQRSAGCVLVVRGDRQGFLILEISRAVGMFIFGIAAVKFFSNSFFAVAFASSAATLFVGIWGTFRSSRGVDFRVQLSTSIKNFLYYGIPLIPAAVVGATLTSSDRFFLNAFSGPSSVALYAAAAVLAKQPMDFLFGLAPRAFYQLIEAFECKGPIIAGQRLGELISAMAIITFPAAAGLIMVSKPISCLLLAPEYVSTATIVVPFTVIAALCSGFKLFVFDHIFHMMRRNLLNVINSIPGAVVGIALMILLIPRYGIIGCSVAYLVQHVFSLATTMIVTRHQMRIIVPWTDLLKVSLATIGMIGVLELLANTTVSLNANGQLVVLIGAGVLAYGSLLTLLRPSQILEFLPGKH
jgi:O-antigen/teichoic acid export membrane protein